MNNTFDWTRFKKLVAMDFRGIWPRFGMAMIIITLIPVAIWLFFLLIDMSTSREVTIPAFGRLFFMAGILILTAIMAPSAMYKTCNLPKDGIYYAMLPASHLEKYLSQLLYCVIVCPLMCLLAGIVVDTLLTLLPFGVYREYLWEPIAILSGSYDADMALIGEESAEAMQIIRISFGAFVWGYILSYLKYSATFLFTNTIFKTHKVLKTILALIALNFFISLIAYPVLFHVMVNADSIDVAVPENIISSYKAVITVSNVVTALLAAGLFFWTFFRLKHMKY